MAIVEMKSPLNEDSILSLWMVKNGDYVIENQHIAEVENDKVSVEVNAKKKKNIKLKIKAGEKIPAGFTICCINTDGFRPKKKKKN